jgi:hypothetical protein
MPPTERALDLDQFTLATVTFEARTEPNFLQWDRAGQLWSAFLVKRPNLELVNASPDNTLFQDSTTISFALSLKPNEGHTSLVVTEQRPHPSLKNIIEGIEQFIDITSEALEFDEFTRIGIRLYFVKDFEDLTKASEALLATRLLLYPEGPHFGIEGKPTQPAYVLRWEDGKKGVTIRMQVEKRLMEFNPPAEMTGIEAFRKEVDRLLFDLDYYTIAKVALSQLVIGDWITNALHVIRRDSDKFLRGL